MIQRLRTHRGGGDPTIVLNFLTYVGGGIQSGDVFEYVIFERPLRNYSFTYRPIQNLSLIPLGFLMIQKEYPSLMIISHDGKSALSI